MKENSLLLEKSKNLALNIIDLCKSLRQKKEYIMSDQVLRSGTSIGANIREAYYATSKADFIAKMHIALKECFETEYWLELLHESEYIVSTQIISCCKDVKHMLIASCKTAKSTAI